MARPKRTLRTLFLLLLAATVVALGVSAFRADTRSLRKRLVADIARTASAQFPRPVHAGPTVPGTFGALASAPWVALAAEQARSTDVEFCRAVRDGEVAFSAAPASCLHELAQGDTALSALLLATHAQAAGPPSGLGLLDVPAPEGGAPRTFLTAAYAARMGALRVRAELAAHRTERALGTCEDLLALARDLSYGTGLQGRLAAVTVSEVAFGPCAAALDAAPAAQKRAAADVLARIAEATPSLSQTLTDFSVGTRAQLFAPYLGASLTTLPKAVQAWGSSADVRRPSGFEGAVALGSAWRALQRWLDGAVDAARLPPGEASEALSAVSAEEEARFQGLALPELGGVALSDARVRAELLLLRRAAEVDALRSETGSWPALQTLSPPLRAVDGQALRLEDKGSEAVLTDSAAPRGGLELLLHADP